MAATIAQYIGKINPKFYAINEKELLQKYGSAEIIPAEEVKEKPLSKHGLVYDSAAETLEPVYFFILDLMNDFGLDTQKLIDNFSSSPGSGHFAELGQRATIMQNQASSILGNINTVVKSILNILYDLKDFRLRLQQYDALKTNQKEAALLALKQLWMDKVDINKGNSSIKAMALGQSGFQTLISAFLFVKNEEDVDKIDLNEVIKRILRGRILEFNHWIEQSERELRKRYELEKTYLSSQVNSLKLYSRWAKPYLKAAQQLEMTERGREPALVNVFNTMILELTLIGKRKLKTKEEAMSGNLPRQFEKMKTKDYYACVLIDFRFRGIPQRLNQQQPHYVFGGRADISFKSYVLNEDELKKLDEELDASDLNDALRLIEGITTESLAQMQDEINFFLEEKPKEEMRPAQKDTSNPFKALFGRYEKQAMPEKKPAQKTAKQNVKIMPETYAEKIYLRPLAAKAAQELAFKIFDVYKKAHGMPSYT